MTECGHEIGELAVGEGIEHPGERGLKTSCHRRLGRAPGLSEQDSDDATIRRVDAPLDQSIRFEKIQHFRDRRVGYVTAVGDLANRQRRGPGQHVQNVELGIAKSAGASNDRIARLRLARRTTRWELVPNFLDGQPNDLAKDEHTSDSLVEKLLVLGRGG
jgi:hypothetical protein